MVIKTYIKSNTYQDSVALMRLSDLAAKKDGVSRVSVMMGTPLNKTMLTDIGMYVAELDAAQPSDLMVVVEAEKEDVVDSVLKAVEDELNREAKIDDDDEVLPATLAEQLQKNPDINIAAISTPGAFAASEARKALKLGLNVFLFSDNVSIEDEVDLKTYAHKNELLVMGPDCGTSLLGGTPLGFVNIVSKGSIGIVGASGTGMQEIMCRVDQMGCGISNAIGVGSHDLSAQVGGISMLDGMKLLAQDKDTKVIVLVSKPPEDSVAEKICLAAKELNIPVVVCFIGSENLKSEDNIHIALTLEEAACCAVKLAGGQALSECGCAGDALTGSPKGYIRGLYSGGTLAYEAIMLMKKSGLKILSNISSCEEERLADHRVSQENSVVDMGDDKFTVGKPHPMIDYSGRMERMLLEAKDPQVKVILMDVLTGFGSIADPAAVLVPALTEALSGREDLSVVIHICGTDKDIQSMDKLSQAIAATGAYVELSHEKAVKQAMSLLFE